jgi:hypothetical protein
MNKTCNCNKLTEWTLDFPEWTLDLTEFNLELQDWNLDLSDYCNCQKNIKFGMSLKE